MMSKAQKSCVHGIPLDDREWQNYSADQRLSLRQEQFRLLQEDSRRSTLWTKFLGIAIDTTVIAAAIAMLGAAFDTYWEARSAERLEREKFRSAIILQGVTPDDIQKSTEYWTLLTEKKIVHAE